MKVLTLYLILLFSLPSVAQDVQASKPTALTIKTIKAYEAKAEAKVKELFSYLELLTEPGLNPEMKAQVRRNNKSF